MVEAPGTAPGSERLITTAFIAIAGRTSSSYIRGNAYEKKHFSGEGPPLRKKLARVGLFGSRTAVFPRGEGLIGRSRFLAQGSHDIVVEFANQTWKDAVFTAVLGIGIVILATAAGYGGAVAFDVWSNIHEPRAFAAGEIETLITARVAFSLFAFQLVTVASVLLADAYRRRTTGTSLLSFQMPRGGFATLGLAVLVLLSMATCFASLVFVFNPEALRHDLQPFSEMMQSKGWWLILIAAGIGAPLAEELLFRGLIFGGLRRTPLGFIGATLITAGSWAALHASYSIYGLGAIALIGLYLAWLRERTGGLLTPVVCHGVYNSVIIFLMVLAPNSSLTTG
jgi:membrane protease YdiL (CAAX protease family)